MRLSLRTRNSRCTPRATLSSRNGSGGPGRAAAPLRSGSCGAINWLSPKVICDQRLEQILADPANSSSSARPSVVVGGDWFLSMKLDRILVVFGTRPEAIKMAPVVEALRSSSAFQVKVCVTAQHRELLNQVLATFSITPDFDLNLMQPNQQLAELTARVLCGMSDLYRACRPDLVLVHGDTTTTFAASLAAFYERIPAAHVEAGLRSHDKYSPWPEESNRCLASVLATWHFAPTVAAKTNLLLEGINPESVIVTGNTIVDAVKQIVSRFDEDSKLRDFYDRRFSYLDPTRRLLLVTAHRRDSFGEGFKRICAALQELALRKDVEIVYPVHPNENVCKPVQKMVGGIANIHLIPPQE